MNSPHQKEELAHPGPEVAGKGASIASAVAPETIVAAAIRRDVLGQPHYTTQPPPARHGDLFTRGICHPDDQGFMTSAGRFVEREEALRIALASGQPMIDHPSRHDRLLFSEDLW